VREVVGLRQIVRLVGAALAALWLAGMSCHPAERSAPQPSSPPPTPPVAQPPPPAIPVAAPAASASAAPSAAPVAAPSAAPRLPSAQDYCKRAFGDYDHDGVTEALTETTRSTDSAGGTTNDVDVRKVRGRSVMPYAKVKGLRVIAIVDQDDDGRPDLVVDPHRAVVSNVHAGWEQGKRPWSILAHSQPNGRFSTTDAASQDYARWLCPEPFKLPDALSAGPRCCAWAAHCARLWGLAPADIEQALKAYCQAASGNPWCEGSLDEWRRIARSRPPFVLTPRSP